MLSGNCGKDTNHSSAKTVKFLGYKFHVECRNLQSYDLYLLKSPFITCNIFFLPVQDFFSFCCQTCLELRGANWKMPQVFLRPITKSEGDLLYLKDIYAPYDPSLRMYINHTRFPAGSCRGKLGRMHRAGQELDGLEQQL